MAKKTWEQRQAERAEVRRAKQEAWAARNKKHQPLPADQRSKLPKASIIQPEPDNDPFTEGV